MATTEYRTPSRVIQIRRSDEADSYVLLHVSRSDPTAFELSIAATEGENPYASIIRQSHLKGLRAKNYQGSDDEWENIILTIFGLRNESAANAGFLSGIESSASITASGDDDHEMVISIRKRIQGITQRLGSVTLQQDDEQAIQLFEWSSIAITRADTMEQQLGTLLDRCRAAEDTIASLNKQLEELISSKNQHEEQLMADFVQLLNEKKLKIRNQQRLLASAQVDKEKLSNMQEAINTGDTKLNKTRRSKRPAKESIEDELESDDGFEKMDVDKSSAQTAIDKEDETDDPLRSTPEPSEDEGSTTSDGEGFTPPVKDLKISKQPEARSSDPIVTRAPPPRRDLPFARRTQKVADKVVTPPEKVDGETAGETDDDEL